MRSDAAIPRRDAAEGFKLAHGYPRPQLERERWTSLNGPWSFAFDNDRRYDQPADVASWPMSIEVPFPPESVASGIGDEGYHYACWYQRTFECSPDSQRVLLHFGFMDLPDVPLALAGAASHGLLLEPMETSYFLSRETVLPTGKDAGISAKQSAEQAAKLSASPAMPATAKRLFAGMSQATGSAAAFFNLPDNAVVELGARVRI